MDHGVDVQYTYLILNDVEPDCRRLNRIRLVSGDPMTTVVVRTLFSEIQSDMVKNSAIAFCEFNSLRKVNKIPSKHTG